ncbi:hypothetical protein NLG97_g7531 [Lecanicillium saksenae]|uniref:Uncharacterized protein n=1 Tax=Lecanicillium saksenae TaxID=468837 RepID=A0ACC1QLK2_9HYPO|nr:hypothetical protein NLG97_g7531 [Lecanicillium saksenae]
MPTTDLLDPLVYTLVWIAPLDVEARAALALFLKIHEGHFAVARGHDYVFHAGEIAGHNTILATLTPGSYGTGSAAGLASQVKILFPNLWLGLLVGVAAGLPRFSHLELPDRDIRLGDVLVAQPSSRRDALIAYDLGRVVDDSGSVELLRDGHALARIEPLVLSAAGKLKQRPGATVNQLLQHYKEIENEICDDDGNTFADPGDQHDILWDGNSPVHRPPRLQRTRVWYGSIGSGEKLMRDATTRDRLRDEFDLIGLEMEAAGVINAIPVGVIRGVCDYGDRGKNKQWQPYAAAVAAAYAKQLLQMMPPSSSIAVIETPQKASGILLQNCLESLAFREMESRFRTMDPAADGTCTASGPEALPHLLEEFEQMRKKYGAKLQWYAKDLCKHLNVALSTILQTQSVYIFVDALDECGKDNGNRILSDFQRFIDNFNSSNRYALRICFTCRHRPEWKWQPEYEILVDQLNRDDISTYVRAELSGTYAHFSDLIVAGAEGSFLWSYLAVKRVLDQVSSKSRQAVEEDIRSIPPELNEVYQEIMEDATADSIKLAQLVCFSTRPMSVNEIRWAMFIDGDCQHTSLASCESSASFTTCTNMMKKVVRELSRGLVEVKSISDSIQVVQFIHHSVKDYFTNELLGNISAARDNKNPPRAQVTATAEAAHRRLAQICLRYLAMEEIRGLNSSELSAEADAYSFLEYATTSWVVHLRLCGIEDTFAWLPTAEDMKQWVKIYQLLRKYSPTCPLHGTTLLHILSTYGIMGALRAAAARRPEEIDAKDDHGRTPLSWAAASGQMPAVNFLISTKQACLNTQDKDGWTPLWYAAANLQESVVRLLLTEHQASVNESDQNGQNVVIWAATHGHSNITRLLLATDSVDVNVKDGRGWTPLMSAASHGHEDIVEQLLNLNVDLDNVNLDGKSAVGDSLNWLSTILVVICQQALSIVFLSPLVKPEIYHPKTQYLFCCHGVFIIPYLCGIFYHDLWTPPPPRYHHLMPEKLPLIFGFFPYLLGVLVGTLAVAGYWTIAKTLFAWMELLAGFSTGLGIAAALVTPPKQWSLKLEPIPQLAIMSRLLQKKFEIEKLQLSAVSVDVCSGDWYARTLFIWALERENEPIINLLLAKRNLDINAKDSQGRTLLLFATENGYETAVKVLSGMASVAVDKPDKNGNTALLSAAENGHATIVKYLLATGKPNINARNNTGESPLLVAARNGHAVIVKQLLASRAVDVDATDRYGMPPLLWAAINSHRDVVECLLLEKTSLELGHIRALPQSLTDKLFDVPSPYFDPFLPRRGRLKLEQILSQQIRLQIVKLLLPGVRGTSHHQILALINDKDWCGKLLFFWATVAGYTTVLDLLARRDSIYGIRHNSRVEAILRQLSTERGEARDGAAYPFSRVCLSAVRSGVRGGKRATREQKLLPKAIKCGDSAAVEWLLASGDCYINATDEYSQTPLRLAAVHGQSDIVKHLLTFQNVAIDIKDLCGYTPLLCAAVRGHEGIVQHLLARGAGVEWEDIALWSWFRRRCKFLTSCCGVRYMMVPLIGESLMVSLSTREACRILFPMLGFCLAWILVVVPCYQLWPDFVKSHRATIVRLLLPDESILFQRPVQVDVELKGWYSRALLFWAIEGRYEAIVNLLVDVRQVDVNTTDAFGRTALTRSIIKGHRPMVQLLLTKGQIDINSQDSDGRTALSWAATKGDEAVVRLLLENGSIATIADKAGRLPAWYATEEGWRDIVDMLDTKR